MSEILRLKQLNVEFLETLQLTGLWFIDYQKKTGAPVPNVEVLGSLMRKADQLLDEIISETPPSLQHRKRTPDDATEP